MSDTPSTNRFARISKESTITVGVAVLLVGAVVGWSNYNNSRYATLNEKMTAEIGKLRDEIQSLKTALAVQATSERDLRAIRGDLAAHEKLPYHECTGRNLAELTVRIRVLEESLLEMRERMREVEKREKKERPR